jgi:hypothetical protein
MTVFKLQNPWKVAAPPRLQKKLDSFKYRDET